MQNNQDSSSSKRKCRKLVDIMRPKCSNPVKLSIAEQRQNLPIYKLKDELIKTIQDNQITIIVGETGSGKSTQITQYLAEAKYGLFGKICCTQPRCVAAVSLAERVAEEFGCEIGKEVGYSIRFCNMTCEETLIQYMTDGVLLRKCKNDSDFLEYSVIILDEAHERTIHTDILFALLKEVVTQRPQFKLIVTSATLDARKFSEYFFNAPIFTIPGRTFPVEVFHSSKTQKNYFEASLIKVMDIHLNEPPGDILLFFPGEKEIMKACKILESRAKYLSGDQGELLILPIYSGLPTFMQAVVFRPAPDGYRKVVVATNIAETSLTIDGISYVIDPGYVKHMTYDPKSGQNTLDLILISQAQAKQRTGRAGRTGPGKCYRLYTENDYEIKMLPTTNPAMKDTNLICEILQLKYIGFNDIINFDFMDAPPAIFLTTALKELQSLLALDEEQNMTELGKIMSEFPLIPNLTRALINSVDLGCSDEMLTIISLMSAGSVFYRPMFNENYHKTFHLPEGDHLTLLNVYNEWKDNNFASSWCYDNKIHGDNLLRAQNVREQLLRIMARQELPVISCHGDNEKIEKAFCSGFFANVAVRQASGFYKTARGNKMVKIHPSSALCGKNFKLVVYKDLIKTFATYISDVVLCKPEWLEEFRNNRDYNFKKFNTHQQNGSSLISLEENLVLESVLVNGLNYADNRQADMSLRIIEESCTALSISDLDDLSSQNSKADDSYGEVPKIEKKYGTASFYRKIEIGESSLVNDKRSVEGSTSNDSSNSTSSTENYDTYYHEMIRLNRNSSCNISENIEEASSSNENSNDDSDKDSILAFYPALENEEEDQNILKETTEIEIESGVEVGFVSDEFTA